MRLGAGIAFAGMLLVVGCTAGAGVDLQAVPPCEVLEPTQLAEVDLAGASAEPGDAGVSTRTCTFTTPGNATPVTLAVDPSLRLADVRDAYLAYAPDPAPLVDGEVAGRPALVGSGERCFVAVEVGSGALSVFGGDDCAAVRRMAELAVTNLAT